MTPRHAAGNGAIAAAACVACCAPPIIAALGLTAGLAVTAGVFLGIAAAIAVAILGTTSILARRARPKRTTTCRPATTVAIEAPTRRSSGGTNHPAHTPTTDAGLASLPR